MAHMEIKKTTIEGRHLLSVSGELDITTAPELRRVLMKHLKGVEPGIAIELSALDFMDTSGLATLIEARLKIEQYGGRLVLFGLQPSVAELFQAARVTSLFTMFPNQEEALQALRQAAS